MRKTVRMLSLCFVICLPLIQPPSVYASENPSLEQQREWFAEARLALKADDSLGFQQLYKKLETYPLRPYLDIWSAWRDVENNPIVIQTLERYADVPESEDLRLAWIQSLSERGQWPHVAAVLKEFPHSAKRLPKVSLLSAWYNDDKAKAFEVLEELWSRGVDISRYHAAFLHDEWHAAGYPHISATQARAVVFVKRGKWRSLHALNPYLSHEDQRVLAMWKQVQKQPVKFLPKLKQAYSQHLWYELVVEDGLRRLSRHDIDAAWQWLQQLKLSLSLNSVLKLQRNIALRAAKQQYLPALSWLDGLPLEAQTDATRAWHVRLLLLKEDWQAVLAAILAMPKQQQEKSAWLYWQAFALGELGQVDQAKGLLEDLALGRGYYSFLSADRLGLAYQMGDLNLDLDVQSQLLKKPFMRRAYEWIQLKEAGKARREWQIGMRGASQQTWKAALQLAASWGWYERTIRSASKAGAFDALDLRFPMAFPKAVNQASQLKGLDHSLVWSVIRQESIFNAQAVSRVGAKGLMQLMPKTAKYVAKKHGMKLFRAQDLLIPAVNIRLGSLYLSDLLQRFDGNRALAIAAYNAGTSRVKRWQGRFSFTQADIWIELIPFKETRRYVQQVMAYTAVYDWRQKKTASPLIAKGSTMPVNL